MKIALVITSADTSLISVLASPDPKMGTVHLQLFDNNGKSTYRVRRKFCYKGFLLKNNNNNKNPTSKS